MALSRVAYILMLSNGISPRRLGSEDPPSSTFNNSFVSDWLSLKFTKFYLITKYALTWLALNRVFDFSVTTKN